MLIARCCVAWLVGKTQGFQERSLTFVGRGMTEIWEEHKMGKRKALKLNFDSKVGLRSSFILK